MTSPTVLITGASSGIGYELAHTYARNDYALVVVARREERLVALKAELEKKYQSEVKVIVKDLALESSSKGLYEQLEADQIKVDVLINNAGVGDFSSFTQIEEEKLNRMIDLNIKSLTLLSRLFVQGMVERGSGYIINIASTAAFQPLPMMAVYGATKAYVLSFTEALAEELKDTGVGSMALCPGVTESEFQVRADMKNFKLNRSIVASSQDVAEYTFKAMEKSKIVAVHGVANKLGTLLPRFLPRSWISGVSKKIMESVA